MKKLVLINKIMCHLQKQQFAPCFTYVDQSTSGLKSHIGFKKSNMQTGECYYEANSYIYKKFSNQNDWRIKILPVDGFICCR